MSIDIETYSGVDLKKCGLYKYVQSPNFQILMIAFTFDNEPVRIIDLLEETADLRKSLLALKQFLINPKILKTAYNAKFEIECLSKLFEVELDSSQWQDTMALAAYAGLPGSLKAVAEALRFKADKQKDRSGKALIDYFSKPCKATSRNGMRTRNLPHHEPAKWELFKNYCMQDVEVERAVRKELETVDLSSYEQKQWELDHLINRYGVTVDINMVRSALMIDEQERRELTAEIIEITGLENPNSVAQLKLWLEQEDVEMEALNKANVSTALANCDSEVVKRVLEIRQKMSKSSLKKYVAIENTLCDDGRVRGLLQYYGANRTGRWAGRFVQIQNLPRNHISALDVARELVKHIKPLTIKAIYGDIADTLSQLIRTAFIPKENHSFVVADFSAIEARVIAWLADEAWRLEVFATHGKIYEASASAMFGVPLEKIKKGNKEYELRAKGKIAELALGYQGSAGALKAMGAEDMGLSETEISEIVFKWRGANKQIVELWYTMQNAAMDAVQTGQLITINKNISFLFDGSHLKIKLPSGRELFYRNTKIEIGDKGYAQITYDGVNDRKQWARLPTYGGKLVENIVQAIARDCLAETLMRVHSAGYNIVFHVHDEVVVEVPKEQADNSLKDLLQMMANPIEWADGLILKGDGFITDYYKKD